MRIICPACGTAGAPASLDFLPCLICGADWALTWEGERVFMVRLDEQGEPMSPPSDDLRPTAADEVSGSPTPMRLDGAQKITPLGALVMTIVAVIVVGIVMGLSSWATAPTGGNGHLDCGEYATAAAGGEAFRGSIEYNSAHAECEQLNATADE